MTNYGSVRVNLDGRDYAVWFDGGGKPVDIEVHIPGHLMWNGSRRRGVWRRFWRDYNLTGSAPRSTKVKRIIAAATQRNANVAEPLRSIINAIGSKGE